jgi:hypothetical protein
MAPYTAPVFFTDRSKELNTQFYVLLNNITASYPDAKINVADTEKQATYNANMIRMQQLQSDYFIYRNKVVKESESLSNAGQELDKQVNDLDGKIKIVQDKIDDLKNSGYSAEGMLDDTKLTRNQIAFGNIVLAGILIASGYMLYKKGFGKEAIAAVAAKVVAKVEETTKAAQEKVKEAAGEAAGKAAEAVEVNEITK